MPTWLEQLIAPQTTALETVTFIVVVSVLCTLCAAAVYCMIMIVLRRSRWPDKKLRDVFLPGPDRLREMSWEYFMAFFTACVLTATLIEKKQIVDTVLAFPVAEIGPGNAHALRSLLPLHAAPNVDELGADSVSVTGFKQIFSGRRSAEYAAARTLALVRPVLEEGRTELVEALFTALVPEAIRRSKGWLDWARTILLVLTVLLVVANLVRLVSARAKELKKDPADASPEYTDTLRGLFGAGVALALLLASPLTVSDPTAIAQSAVRSARHDTLTASEKKLATAVGNVIDAQLGLQEHLRILGDTTLGSLSGVVARLGHAAERLRKDVDLARDEQSASREALRGEIAALTGQVNGLASSVAGLSAAGRERTELVMILAPNRTIPYSIVLDTPSRPEVAKGAGSGLFRLPPGAYRVQISRVPTIAFTLALGAPRLIGLDSPGSTVVGTTLGAKGAKVSTVP